MLAPGQQIGEFRIERVLAEGGMGTVYVATQLSTGRQRALKAMHARLAGHPGYMERFVAEARVGSRIHSEHVVEVLAAGVDVPTGTPWLAMELLDGMSLEQLVVSRGPLPPHEALPLFEQTCHGLAAAHAAGIVHRDLKPENLFIAHSRTVGLAFVVKILDFGIAKWTQEAMTASGSQAIGTPFWMAPEQTQVNGPIGPRTDLWALGLLVFYALTGRTYWWCAQPNVNATMPQFLNEALMQPLELPSMRAQRLGIGVALPPAFDGWFLRCLDRDPARRFESADECMRALSSVLAPRSAPTSAMGTMPMVAVPLPPQQSWAGHAGYTPQPQYASPVHSPAPSYSFDPPPNRTGLYVGAAAALLLVTLGIGGGALALVASMDDDDEEPIVHASTVPPDDGFTAALEGCEGALRNTDPDSAAREAQRALSIRPGEASASGCRDRASAMSADRATFDEGSLALSRGDYTNAYSTFGRLPRESPFRGRPEVPRAAQSLAHEQITRGQLSVQQDPGQAFLIARSVARMSDITPAQTGDARALEVQARERAGSIYEGRVTTGQGITSDACAVLVESASQPDGINCRVRVRCGERTIYGDGTTGYASCQRADSRFTSGSDPYESRQDSDPSMRFDLATRQAGVRDAALGLDVVLELVDP